MKHFIMAILLLSIVLLSACNSIKVPKSTMDHKMSATPTNVIPTKSEWKIAEHPQANENIPISILIKDKTNQPIHSFETIHEKKMHLFIVSKDLSYFSHIHPNYKGNGEFTLSTTFPAGSDYKMIADVTPKGGGDSSIESHWQHVEGEAAQEVPLVPDQELVKVVDGKKVTLSFSQLKAGETLHMTYTITDAATNNPIKNLQPYLGAMGHTVAMSADAENYLHIHPMTTSGNGPKVIFMTIFPKSGVYKVWGQFKYEGKVFTVPFVIDVPNK
ncbi:hypothetical protein J1P26_06005 [Neobacillus sp. MM2021_6]|uniref:hypothetical protein n=1 Tax=Bacillaceae TaxID=186817 RepID=UPI00140968D4|nr:MULTISPECIES: hypothetical protein [Bacillaceae]MBO0959281.1 hypothetical protein [Neobacillus sp. MM2021_6]NHC20612.1 hypothetical protein [Bacillus sp. MM2020_4]